MKNKIFLFVFSAITLIILFSLTVSAVHPPRLVDDADILADTEEERVGKLLDDISLKNNFDVIVVTVESVGAYGITDYADDFYDYGGYGMGDNYDGVLLLISMEERDWHISGCGSGERIFNNAGIRYVGSEIVDHLSAGLYAEAFCLYAEVCDSMIGTVDGEYKEPYNVLTSLIISLVVGLVIAFISVSVMKSQLNGAVQQSGAGGYIKSGSLELSVCRDSFLYRNIIRRARQQSSSSGSHRSSSGRSHSGGGGKF